MKIQSYIESVKIAFFETLSLLAEVGTPELFKLNDVLMPLILDALKQSSELYEAALGLLETYVYCTGYVIIPYLQYPPLMDALINRDKNANGSFIVNTRMMRCLGVLGALDPFILNQQL